MTATSPEYFAHPVFDQARLHLDTPAIRALSEFAHGLLWRGAPGGVVMGAARSGKTTGLHRLPGTLTARDGTRVPSRYVSRPVRDQRTVLSVFRQLCMNAGSYVGARESADVLAARYVEDLAEVAAAAESPSVVLFVDEMQRLTPLQFNAFAELYDALRERDIQLSVLFTGNDQECEGLLEAIEAPEYAHVHGRFFTHRMRFRGLTSRQEVQQCLEQYDRLRYPEGGPTYTEYFLPKAFERGWRLESIGSDLWRLFHEQQKAYRIDSWGMQYFTVTVNLLLADYLAQKGVESLSDELIRACIQASGIVRSLIQSK